MTKPPQLPDYDPARDGNRFAWIVRSAQALREQRAAWNAQRRMAVRRKRQDKA